MRVLYPGQIGIWKCWFLWRGKTKEPREKPSEQGENQQEIRPTYDPGLGNQTQATFEEGECYHHCAIPASSNDDSVC